jgi:hypothetical protein
MPSNRPAPRAIHGRPRDAYGKRKTGEEDMSDISGNDAAGTSGMTNATGKRREVGNVMGRRLSDAEMISPHAEPPGIYGKMPRFTNLATCSRTF